MKMGFTQRFLYCLFVVVLANVQGSMIHLRSTVDKVFQDYEIVPDGIPKAPNKLIKVSYVDGIEVDLGEELTPTQVNANAPTLEWDTKSDKLYTLVNIDLDVPSRTDPSNRSTLHWLVVNINGNDLASGETLASYMGSYAQLGSGLHRYVFLVYKQKGLIDFSNSSSPTRRAFSVTDFAEEYNLGKPLAGNFYQAQWDESVPVLPEY